MATSEFLTNAKTENPTPRENSRGARLRVSYGIKVVENETPNVFEQFLKARAICSQIDARCDVADMKSNPELPIGSILLTPVKG